MSRSGRVFVACGTSTGRHDVAACRPTAHGGCYGMPAGTETRRYEELESKVREVLAFDGLRVAIGRPRGQRQLTHTQWHVEVAVVVVRGTPAEVVDAGILALESLSKIDGLAVAPFNYLPDDVGYPNPAKPIKQFWTELIWTELIYEE
jgi:hypothetical protein